MNKVKVKWQASDGYVGGSRPQSFSLDLDAMAEDCETEAEARDYLDQEIRDDFENKVSYSCDNEEEIIEAWKQRRELTEGDRQ